MAKNHFKKKKKKKKKGKRKKNDNNYNYSGNILSSFFSSKDFFIIVTKSNLQIAVDIGIEIFNIFFTLNKRLNIKK